MQFAIALDQLFNALLGGWADETLSARVWRNKSRSWYWKALYWLINTIFFWQDDHCFQSYNSEVKRNQLPKEYGEADPEPFEVEVVEIHFQRHLKIWLTDYLPMVFKGFFVVAWMLLTDKDMTKGPWGNEKYPLDKVDTHYKAPANGSFWKRWSFYAVRNPVSNYGHNELKEYPPLYEHLDYHKWGLTWNFGYKASGTFKMRPRFK